MDFANISISLTSARHLHFRSNPTKKALNKNGLDFLLTKISLNFYVFDRKGYYENSIDTLTDDSLHANECPTNNGDRIGRQKGTDAKCCGADI